MTRPPRGIAGLTLVEMLVATSILSVSVAGTMSAFVTALRIRRAQNGPVFAEAGGYAEYLLEGNRNHLASLALPLYDSWFQTHIGAHAPPIPNWAGTAFHPSGWDDDPATLGVIKRRYRVDRVDCDGTGPAGITPSDPSCYRVAVRVCWNDPTTCP